MTRTLITLAISLTLLAAGAAQAALLLNDPIPSSTAYDTDWSDGTSNVGYNSATASWSGDPDYVLDGAGGLVRANSYNAWRGAQRDWGTAVSGQIWVSVLMDERTAAASDAGIVLALENGGYSSSGFDGFAFGISGNGNLMTSQSGAAPAEVSGPISIPASGGWTLFVAKITVNGGGANDTIDLWAFDSTSSFGQTEASLGTKLWSSAAVQYGDDVQDVWVGGHRNASGVSGAGDFDNVRVSDAAGNTGLAEVLTTVPEPATLTLLGAGGLLAMGRRRRK